MSNNPLEDLLGSRSRRKPRPYIDPDVEETRLRDACAVFLREYGFVVGDLVVLKRGIRIESALEGRGSEPVYVVLDLIDDAEMVLDVTHLEHYGIRYDVIIGHYDEDGDFITSPMDSRRLQPWVRQGTEM
jgi:hypothetical protein